MSHIDAPRPADLARVPEVPDQSPDLLIASQESGIGDFPLSYYWFLLVRGRWLILTFTLVVTVAISVLTLALPKKYQSSVLIRLDPQGRNVVGDNRGGQAAPSMDAELLVGTEAKVVTSPAVIKELIQNLNLTANPEFMPKDSHGQALTPLQLDEVEKAVTRDISVDQPIGTLLLQINFRCHDPVLAANAANTLAQVYLEHDYATRAHALHDASRNMVEQLDSMRAQMEQAQSALVNYESTHDVIDPDDKNNIYQARLSQINATLSDAEAARMQIEAEYDTASSGNPDALLATKQGAALLPLEQRMHADERQLGQLATIYGRRHPLYIQQEKVVLYDQQLISQQAQHITLQLRSEYRAALARENLIRSALNQEKTAMDAFNMRTIRYHSLKAAADSATKLYYDLQQRIQDATVASGLHSQELRVISPAQISPIPVFPRPFLFGLLAFIGSLGLGCLAVIVAGLMDKTISTPEQVELRFHARVVASLPLVADEERSSLVSIAAERYESASPTGGDNRQSGIVSLKRRTAFQEAILGLHSTLKFAATDALHVLALTSSVPGEGKSTVSCHLAAAFAAMGTRTILVDADMRKPNVHRIFKIQNTIGLSSVLRQQQPFHKACREMGPNLIILPSGPSPANPAELLHLHLPELIAQLREEFEMVVIDCPPVLGLADASVITNLADGCVLVINAGLTDQHLVTASLRQIHGARANLLGVILNRVSAKLDTYYNYYKSYYQSYYNTAHDDEEVLDD